MHTSSDNEGTRLPYWIIIDPKQNFDTNEDGIYKIASMITGVWFSRELAQKYLDNHRYNFGKNAVVYCHSGCYSEDMQEIWDIINKQN